jgi:hypothetical protein
MKKQRKSMNKDKPGYEIGDDKKRVFVVTCSSCFRFLTPELEELA